MKKINLIYAAAIALMLAGCSADTSVSDVSSADTVVSASSDVVSSSDSSDENSNESAQSENESDNTEVMMKVTSCDGNTITGNKMDQGMGEPPQMGDMPEGEPPSDGNSDGNQPPEMNGDKPEGEPPADGNSDGNQPPEMNGNKPDGAPQMGEEVSYSVGDIDVSNISEGDMVKIILDESGNVISITKEEMPKLLQQQQGQQQGGGFGANGTDNGTAANNADDNAVLSNMSFSSENDDENALRADGVTVSLTDCTITKTGSSSNTENGDFYGMNAALLAENGAQVTVTGGEVSTSATNGNGIFSYGSGTVVNVSGTKIRTAERNSGGIQTQAAEK